MSESPRDAHVLEAFVARVQALSHADRLRLAAGLLEQDQRVLAQAIIQGVALELDALDLFGKAQP